MSRNVPTPPAIIQGNMFPLVASVEILQGQAVTIDTATGQAIQQDNHAAFLFPCIGVAANNAETGEFVFVQAFGVMQVPCPNVISSPGVFVGSRVALTADAFMNDLGTAPISQGLSVAGIAIDTAPGGILTMFVLPTNLLASALGGPNAFISDGFSSLGFGTSDKSMTLIDGVGNSIQLNGSFSGGATPGVQLQTIASDLTLSAGGGGNVNLNGAIINVNGSPLSAPVFVDNETPTTFTTNAEYILANTPNPLSSLQVFINSEAVPKPGQDRLLVQGVDYHLGGTGNKHIIYDVTPTATNTIRCFYRK